VVFYFDHQDVHTFHKRFWCVEKDPLYLVNSVSAWDYYNHIGPGDYEKILEDQVVKFREFRESEIEARI
jgi:hypothetical protein